MKELFNSNDMMNWFYEVRVIGTLSMTVSYSSFNSYIIEYNGWRSTNAESGDHSTVPESVLEVSEGARERS